MTLREALELPSLRRARVVAGKGAIDGLLRWVHVVDNPDPVPWVREFHLVLTTGYAWPREASAQKALVRRLSDRRVAAVGLAVPQFFDHVPESVKGEADRLELPVLEIPWEIPFAEISEEVHSRLLAEQMRVLEVSDTIHRALTRVAGVAKSLDEIASALSGLLHRAVLFVTRGGDVLAAAGTQDAGFDAADFGFPLPVLSAAAREAAETVCDRSGGRSEAAVVVLYGVPRPVRCLAAPIRVRGGSTAMVWLVEGSRSFDRLDERATEHAAVVAALHLAHQSEMASVELRFRRSFLDALVEGRFEATPAAIERARLLGFDVEGRYAPAVAALLEPVPLSATTFERREEVAEGARRRLLDLGAPGLVTASLNRVAMLIPEGVEPRRVFQGLPSDRLAFVVARPVCGVDAVQHSFSEVVTVLPHITEPGLVPLEHLLLPRVLQGDEDAQRALVDKYLTRLLERRGGEALAKTLAALPSEAFHLGRVSRSLGIHISTLRHRLERIEALLEISLQDPKTRIEIGIASILSDKM